MINIIIKLGATVSNIYTIIDDYFRPSLQGKGQFANFAPWQIDLYLVKMTSALTNICNYLLLRFIFLYCE